MEGKAKTEYIQLTIRLPKSLHTTMSGVATEQHWSMNRTVVRGLDKIFNPDSPNIEDIYGVDDEDGQPKGET